MWSVLALHWSNLAWSERLHGKVMLDTHIHRRFVCMWPKEAAQLRWFDRASNAFWCEQTNGITHCIFTWFSRKPKERERNKQRAHVQPAVLSTCFSLHWTNFLILLSPPFPLPSFYLFLSISLSPSSMPFIAFGYPIWRYFFAICTLLTSYSYFLCFCLTS